LIPRFDDICSRRAKSPRWEEARAAGARAHEEPGARSRPFGRAERRCAGRRRSRVSGSDVGRAASRWPSQVPSERERREERRGRADWSCSSAAEERHGTRPLAVTVTEGGGSPSRRKMTWLFPTSFSLSDDRARPKVTAHEFSRRARSAAPGASTPSPSAGECEGSPLALHKIRPRPQGAEGEAAVRVCVNRSQARAGARTLCFLLRSAELRETRRASRGEACALKLLAKAEAG